MPFFKQALPKEVEQTLVEDGSIKATITKVDKVDGDFNAMNRKGKTYVFLHFPFIISFAAMMIFLVIWARADALQHFCVGYHGDS